MGQQVIIQLLILCSITSTCLGFASHANNNNWKHKSIRAYRHDVLTLMMSTSATGEITLGKASQSSDSNSHLRPPLGNMINIDAFHLLIQNAMHTLIMSDTDGEELDHSYGSASQGLWLHSPSAKELQNIIDRLVLKSESVLMAAFQFGDSHTTIDNESAVSEIDDETINKNCNDKNQTKPSNHNHDTLQQDGFESLIRSALHALIKSDVVCGDRTQYGSSTQGRWMFDPAAKDMQNILDRLVIPQEKPNDSTSSLEDELCNQWIQWMKTTPSPLFLDLTSYIHEIITQNHNTEDQWVPAEHLKSVDTSLEQYISRIACHVILLPSGSETAPLSLCESTGSHIYGKLLYGGVNRFRLLKSGKSVRRVGERREVMNPNLKSPSWVQLGGVERKYEAVDMGSAALLELTLLPTLWQDIPTIFDKNILSGEASKDMIMSHTAVGWDPSRMLQLLPKEEESSDSEEKAEPSTQSSIDALQSLEGKQRNEALTNHFETRVGGLQPQIDAIVRRVLDGRSIYATKGNDKKLSRLEAEELSLLGLQPVRGLLLYGKPGVGKTLIVREIARLISSVPPKIVSASELLDRWVGGSERLVRELFKDAEQELKMCQITAAPGEEDTAFLNSALHVIVIDEIDAVFRARIDASITQNSVVNQLLSKLDGVNALPNVLMIGMTNRRELLDPALLRPGRLEVQLEIPMPRKDERREILNIHFGPLRRRNRLSYPLRCAIDGIGIDNIHGDHNPVREYEQKEFGRKRRALKRAASNFISNTTGRRFIIYDLASETEGFSGADIEGLVRCAGSIALSRARVDGGGVESLLITLDDVKQALIEVKV